MFYIACTRFNNMTYDENMRYRDKYNENVKSAVGTGRFSCMLMMV